MTPRIACPNPVCPYPHDVQKVSVVVQSNTATYPNVQTALAQKLSAPAEPLLSAKPTFDFNPGLGLYAALGGGFIGIIAGFLGYPSAYIFYFAVGGALLAQIGPLRDYLERNAEYQESRQIRRATFSQWSAAMQRWELCYYCHRCDTVFIPGEPKYVPSSRMSEIL